MLLHEIREVRDQPIMAACSQDELTPPGNSIVLICRQPAGRLVREPFEAADTPRTLTDLSTSSPMGHRQR
ncbi:hypothetical protein [Mesorhizobium sp. 131-3-5]|uniref:hypothetical protein n=1 Tax=Mesorhizobium sp. 131-3-5 TaxID=2744520 RepID=UPI0018EC17AF|nr:hypothetical protein [Mesorhizobium sp. 131-3-5]